jgi:hypothetical protein
MALLFVFTPIERLVELNFGTGIKSDDACSTEILVNLAE